MQNQGVQMAQGVLNQNYIDQIFQSVRDYHAQLPAPEEPPAPTEQDILQFLERTIPIISRILYMYEICPPEGNMMDRMSWYSRIDELFDEMSRMMNYTFNVWNSFQNLRDVFYPIFRGRERFGRHLTLQEAVIIRNTLMEFQETR